MSWPDDWQLIGPQGQSSQPDNAFYDPLLAQAVLEFQQQQGLKADRILGSTNPVYAVAAGGLSVSYILDALKKSEQQRAGNQPAAAAVHVPLSPAPARSALLPVGWRGLMILVGLLLLGRLVAGIPGVAPAAPVAEQPLTQPAVPEPVTMAPGTGYDHHPVTGNPCSGQCNAC